jgi:predicted patatin/cPLA2 family phospholipase
LIAFDVSLIKDYKSLSDFCGRVFYIKKGTIQDKDWIFDIMKYIERVDKKSFTRKELLSFSPYLRSKYPNNHIEHKTVNRQNFTSRGHCR